MQWRGLTVYLKGTHSIAIPGTEAASHLLNSDRATKKDSCVQVSRPTLPFCPDPKGVSDCWEQFYNVLL